MVIITGAASGIGRDMAVSLAVTRRCRVVLWDLTAGVRGVADEINAAGGVARAYQV